MEEKYNELSNEIDLTNEDHPAVYIEWTKAKALVAIANELARLNDKLTKMTAQASEGGSLDALRLLVYTVEN